MWEILKNFLLYFGLFLASFCFGNCKPQTSLGSKPVRPSFAPSGSHQVGQIIPPGPPWPDSVEGYQNFSSIPKPPPNLVDRLPDITTERSPNLPSFAGGGIGMHMVPPGKPWPDSPEGYKNFSVTMKPEGVLIEDRYPDVVTERDPSRPSFAGSSNSNNRPITNTDGTNDLSTAKPTRLPITNISFVDLFFPLEHTTTNVFLLTSTTRTTTTQKPTIDNDDIPPQSEIPNNKPQMDLNLNNLDFFKPKPQETFFRPAGIDYNENHKKLTNTSTKKPLPEESSTTVQPTQATKKPNININPPSMYLQPPKRTPTFPNNINNNYNNQNVNPQNTMPVFFYNFDDIDYNNYYEKTSNGNFNFNAAFYG